MRAQDGDEAKAQNKTLKERDALAKVLASFRVDDVRSLMDTNNTVSGQLQALLGALAPAEGAALATQPLLRTAAALSPVSSFQ